MESSDRLMGLPLEVFDQINPGDEELVSFETAEHVFEIVLLPGYSNFTVSGCLEVLEMANQILGRNYYGWRVRDLSRGETPAVSSGDGEEGRWNGKRTVGTLLLCGGLNSHLEIGPGVLGIIKKNYSTRARIGAFGSGVFSVAKVGLLNGRNVAVHPFFVNSFTEEVLEATVVDEPFWVHGNIHTATGGLAVVDLMIGMVGDDVGPDLAGIIRTYMGQGRSLRGCTSPQVWEWMSVARLDDGLSRCLKVMQDNIETPLSVSQIASHVGVTSRQIQRKSKNLLKMSPAAVYMEFRLLRARELIKQTAIKVIEVSLACGFETQSHFCRKYKERYGVSPLEDRFKSIH